MASDVFWPTVAQVAPVIALALILEMRALGRRYMRKSRFKKTRIERSVNVVFMFAAAVWISYVFLLAIAHVTEGASDPAGVRIAAYGLAFGFGIVVLGPALTLAGALTGDSWAVFWRDYVPVSKTQRTLRLMKRDEAGIEVAMRARRKGYLAYATTYAEYLVAAHRAIRKAGEGSNRARDAEEYLVRLSRGWSECRAQHEDLLRGYQELKDIFAHARERSPYSESEIESYRQLMKDVL